MKLTKRQLRALFIIGLVVGMVGVPGAVALMQQLSSPTPVSDGVVLRAVGGPRANITGSYTADLSDPHRGGDTIVFNSTAGNITISGGASIEAVENESVTVNYGGESGPVSMADSVVARSLRDDATVYSSAGEQLTEGVDYHFYPDDGVLTWEDTPPTTDGETATITYSYASHPSARVTQIAGTWTNVTDLAVADNPLTLNPGDKQKVTVSGETDALSFKSINTRDNKTDFVYSGDSGKTELTVAGLAANRAFVAVDKSGTILATPESDDSGTATFNLPDSEHRVRLKVSDGGPSYSEPSPTGTQSGFPERVAVTIDDPDFPDDSLNATISYDGTEVKTVNGITEETRVSAQIDPMMGSHNWTIQTTDSFNQTQTRTVKFATPNRLYIRNVSDGELVGGQEVNVRVFDGDGGTVFDRTTTSGDVSLEGLSNSTDLSVEVRTEGFYTRRSLIQDIGEQQAVYLLNGSAPGVTPHEVRFSLSDDTGDFPEGESQLVLRAPVEAEGGETQFRVVSGDVFGQSGVIEQLNGQTRYFLTVRNEDDDKRVLGSFSPTLNETVNLEIDGYHINNTGDTNALKWNASLDGANTSNPRINLRFNDTERETDDVRVIVHERGDEDNEIYNRVSDGPLGTLTVTVPLTEEQAETDWVVRWEATRDGEQINGQRAVGPQHDEQVGGLADIYKWVISLGSILVLGGLFSAANAGVGAVVMAMFGGLWWYIGWLPPEIGGGAVFLAMAGAVLLALRRRGGGF